MNRETQQASGCVPLFSHKTLATAHSDPVSEDRSGALHLAEDQGVPDLLTGLCSVSRVGVLQEAEHVMHSSRPKLVPLLQNSSSFAQCVVYPRTVKIALW